MEVVRFEADNGQEITVTEQDVRDLLAAGGNAVQNVTPQEIKAYLRLCQAQRLNPFTKDAYIVKYGSSPATVIAGKETFTKRAQRNPKFRGYTAGITVARPDGTIDRREGSMMVQGDTLVGGWCSVSIEGYDRPMYDEVAFGEYTTGKSNWAKMPATMIRKVAICHALREAFPEDLGGLYGSEEMDQARERQGAPAVPYQAPQPCPQQAQPAPQAQQPRQHSPLDLYKLALIRARDERGVPCEDAMAAVEAALGKPREEYDADDLAAAVVVVDGLGQPEPEYEVVEEQLPLADDDIPF